MQLYTNRTIIQDFKNYIQHFMTRRNLYTDLTYAEDHTIFAYETGNELGGPRFGDEDVPIEWTREIAQFIKSLEPKKLVVDSTYGVNKTHLSVPEVDIYSGHFYPLNAADIELVGSAKKASLVGEYDWAGLNGQKIPQGDTLTSF